MTGFRARLRVVIWVAVAVFVFGSADTRADTVTVTKPPNSGFSVFDILTPWSNANNAVASDDVYATNPLTTSGTSNFLQASIFGFNLPSDVTVVGIEVTIEASDSLNTGSVTTSVVDLRIGGNNVHFGFASGREDSAPWPGSDTMFTYGSPTDLWDRAWTPSEISSGMSAVIQAQTTGGGQARVDAMWVTVHYFDPGLQGGSLTGKTITSVPVPGFFGGSGGPWTNPSGADASDNIYASSATDVVSDGMMVFFLTEELRVQNFGFDIPSNATIDGIEVKVERRASNTNVLDAGISLFKDGVRVHGPNGQSGREGPNWTLIDEVRSYGSTIDNWEATWTPADINDPLFGVSFAAANGSSSETAFVDRVEVRVHFTPGTTTSGELFSEDFSANGGTETSRNWSTLTGGPVVSAGALQPGDWSAATNAGVTEFTDGATVNVQFDITVPSLAASTEFEFGWRNAADEFLRVEANTDTTSPPLTVTIDGAGGFATANFGTPGSLVPGTTYHVSVAFAPANSTDIIAYMTAEAGPGIDVVLGEQTNVAADIAPGLGTTGWPYIIQTSTGTVDNLEINASVTIPSEALPNASRWTLAGLVLALAFAMVLYLRRRTAFQN